MSEKSHDDTVDSSTTTDDNVASSPKPEAEAVQAEASVSEKPNRFQERIDQLTQRNREEKRKTQALEDRLKTLETKALEPKEPELVKPKEDTFADYQEYENASADYIADKAADTAFKKLTAVNEAKAVKDQQNEREKLLKEKQSSFNVHLKSKIANFKDFDKVAYDHDFMDLELAELIFDIGEKAPEVAYHIGSNLDIAERIHSLPLLERVRELTRLENQIEAVTAKKVSGAPDPITTLGNSEVVTQDPDDLPIDEWVKLRNKQQFG